MLVAEAAANGLSGEYSGIPDGLLLVATILFWSVALDAIAYRWPRFRGMLKSGPTPLIEDGRINQRALRREFMHRDELMAQIRLRGTTDAGDVALAYLEPNGMVSVIRKDGAEVDDPPKPPAAG